MRRTPYYAQIYQYILKQFYTGELKEGDTFDSVEALCNQYAASPNTIRTVLRKLLDEGFVRTGRGKSTVVVSVVGDLKKALSSLYAREDEMKQTFDFMRLVLPSILAYGVHCFSPDEYAEIERILGSLERNTEDIAESYRLRSELIHSMTSKTHNALMCRMVDDAEAVIIFPGIVFGAIPPIKREVWELQEEFYRRMRQFVVLMKKNQVMQAKKEVSNFYRWNKEKISFLIASTGEISEQIPDEPASTYNYLYDRIISDTVDQIYEGVYGEGDFLPPEGRMCEKYGVSLPTVKKAYRTLTELGLTRTLNGRGTQLILFSNISVENVPYNLELMAHLSDFLESLQVLAVTIEDTAQYAAECMDKKSVLALERKMRSLWAAKKGRQVHSIPILLFEVSRATQCGIIEKLYQEIRKRLIWSIYLDKFSSHAKKDQEDRHYKCLEALMELQSGKRQEFARCLALALKDCAAQYKACLERQTGLKSIG